VIVCPQRETRPSPLGQGCPQYALGACERRRSTSVVFLMVIVLASDIVPRVGYLTGGGYHQELGLGDILVVSDSVALRWAGQSD